MRTDSVHVSNDALIQVRELIPGRFGTNYLPEKTELLQIEEGRAGSPRSGTSHRRHARAEKTSRKYLDEISSSFIKLIWQRFVASQMLPQSSIRHHRHFRRRLHVSGLLLRPEIRRLPARLSDARRSQIARTMKRTMKAKPRASSVVEGKLSAGQDSSGPHFTERARFNDATLVKELKKTASAAFDICSIISTLVEREYVTKTRDVFRPPCSASGQHAADQKLEEHLRRHVYGTARGRADEIEEGKLPWREAVKSF